MDIFGYGFIWSEMHPRPRAWASASAPFRRKVTAHEARRRGSECGVALGPTWDACDKQRSGHAKTEAKQQAHERHIAVQVHHLHRNIDAVGCQRTPEDLCRNLYVPSPRQREQRSPGRANIDSEAARADRESKSTHREAALRLLMAYMGKDIVEYQVCRGVAGHTEQWRADNCQHHRPGQHRK